MPKNRPRARIDGYRGPYSRRMLEEARQELIHIIDNKDTVIWQRIRQKTGIYRNGERDDRGQGFGEASTYFSHADLPQEHLSQEPTVENRSNVEIVQYPPPSATVSHPNISIQRHFSPSDSGKDDRAVIINTEQQVDTLQNENSHAIKQETVIDKGNEITPDDLDFSSPDVKQESVIAKGKELNPNNSDFSICAIKQENAIGKGLKGILKNTPIIDLSSSTTKQENAVDNDHERPDNSDLKSSISDSNMDSPEVMVIEDSMENPVVIEIDIGNSSQDLEGGASDVEIIDEVRPIKEGTKHGIMIKCDFCATVTETIDKMNDHLREEVHYSASSFSCDNDGVISCLVERLIATNENAMYKSVLSICPHRLCSHVFKTIHECASHYSLRHHHKSNTRYGLAKVLKEEVKYVQTDKIHCLDCDESFAHVNKYKKHQNKKHALFGERKLFDRCYYFCHSCQSLLKTYGLAICHESEMHYNEGNTSARKLSVLELGKVEIYDLPENQLFSDATEMMEIPKVASQATNTDSHIEDKMVSSNMLENSSHTKPETYPECITIEDSDMSQEVIEISDDDSNIDCSLPVQSGNDKIYNMDEKQRDPNVKIKCDFCETITTTFAEMKEHLAQIVHYSASSFSCNSEGELTHLKERLVITHKNALYKNVLAVCPFRLCGKVFSTIHECSLHFYIMHDRYAPPTYGLMNIFKEETFNIPKNGVYCRECDKSGFNRSQYIVHRQEESLKPIHYKTSTDDQEDHNEQEEKERNDKVSHSACKNTKYYFCHSCQSFKKTYIFACIHRSEKHFDEKGVRKLTIAHVGEIKICYLPIDAVPRIEKPGQNMRAHGLTAYRQISSTLKEVDSMDYRRMYKCDYCDFVIDTAAQVKQHLWSEEHNSASHVLLDHVTHKPKYLLTPMAVVSELLERSVVAICPEPDCFQVFSSIYTCHEHVDHFHRFMPGRQYALAYVRQQETLEFDNKQKGFIEKPEMKQHLAGRKCDDYRAFLCSVCPRMYTDSFTMKTHILKKHPLTKKNKKQNPLYKWPVRQFVRVKFFLLEGNKNLHSLLPFQNNLEGMKASLKNKLDTLRHLSKGETKQTNKILKRKITELVKLK